MRNPNLLHDITPKRLVQSAKINQIKAHLSETDILELQDTFLSNGLHHIKINKIITGRNLIRKFLDTLGVYQHVACLSLSSIVLDGMVTDIYYELISGGYLKPLDPYYLEDFFIDQFYYDFMWIEITPDLIRMPWFYDFEQKLFDYQLDQHIPILVISYDELGT